MRLMIRYGVFCILVFGYTLFVPLEYLFIRQISDVLLLDNCIVVLFCLFIRFV